MRRVPLAIGFGLMLPGCFDPAVLESADASTSDDGSTGAAGSAVMVSATGGETAPTSSTDSPNPTTSSTSSNPTMSTTQDPSTTGPAETTSTEGSTTGDDDDGSEESGESSSTGTTGGIPELCGNGELDRNEECDLGPANNDNAACTTSCLLAICGDGLVEAGPEDCDDAGESAECNDDCTLSSCGDGIINATAGEDCDGQTVAQGSCNACSLSCDTGWLNCDSGLANGCEIDQNNDPANCGGCLNACNEEEACVAGDCVGTKRVFLSSAVLNADFGGVEGADAACQQMADEAGLSGEFFAWLSSADQGVSVFDRFNMHEGPYVLVDGTEIASSWADLTDGTLAAPILLDELGNPPGGFGGGNCHGGATCTQVFTGTTGGGAAYEGQHDDCDGWSTTTFLPAFAGGDANATDIGWTLFAAGLRCDYAARLYCFEQ